ncbi:MAG: TetR/AcrR family transcriptional regulator C-terminal domain-containing protein [Pseudomonadota bacterium]
MVRQIMFIEFADFQVSVVKNFSLASNRTVRYDALMNEHVKEITDGNALGDAPSVREQEVLAAVLDLMVEEGDGFSMAAVAARASCSKETLYRWYGDRDGLLTATVKWQASKVIMPELGEEQVTLAAFSRILQDFAESWLTVLTGDVSIALNRLAVSHAANSKTNLGNIVLENGPLAMRQRLLPIFEIGNRQAFINKTEDEAFRLFFGLVVADAQIRVLLGEQKKPSKREISEFAQRAVEQFLRLCGKN